MVLCSILGKTCGVFGYLHDVHEAEELMLDVFAYLFTKKPASGTAASRRIYNLLIARGGAAQYIAYALPVLLVAVGKLSAFRFGQRK